MEQNPDDIYVQYQTVSPLASFAMWLIGLLLLVIVIAGLIAGWGTFLAASSWIVKVIVGLLLISAIGAVGYIAIDKGLDIRYKHVHARNEERRAQERHTVQLHLLQTRIHADDRGNRAAVLLPSGELVVPPSGNYVQPVPQTLHYAPHLPATKVTEEKQEQRELPSPDFHIPTFAESLHAGVIGPKQKQLLFCHEMVRAEGSQQISGLEPRYCELGDASTLLLCGASRSGKTTYMANIASQQAYMKTLFFAIDPHFKHPDKSLSAKLAAIIQAGYFVLPPAMTNMEVYRVFKSLQAECQARVDGKETRLSGYNIVFLVDEIVALFANAQRTSNKEIQQMYAEFGVFLRDLGVQYNKFGVNGVFGTQYVTKEVLGDVEWRDACTGQGVMRLPANQAQSLKLLHGDDLRSVPRLPPGHGYMVFGGEYEPMRMASGNTTVADVELVARSIPPSPLTRKQYAPGGSIQRDTAYLDHEQYEASLERSTVIEGGRNQRETSEKPARNQFRNQLETALGADLAEKALQVLAIEAEGGQKPEIMKTVWNVSPGASQRYKDAEDEYKRIKRQIAEIMKVGA